MVLVTWSKLVELRQQQLLSLISGLWHGTETNIYFIHTNLKKCISPLLSSNLYFISIPIWLSSEQSNFGDRFNMNWNIDEVSLQLPNISENFHHAYQ